MEITDSQIAKFLERLGGYLEIEEQDSFDLDLDLPERIIGEEVLDFSPRSQIHNPNNYNARYYVATQGEIKEDIERIYESIPDMKKDIPKPIAVAIDVNRYIDIESIKREGDSVRFGQNGVGLRQVMKKVGENGFLVLYGCGKEKENIEDVIKVSMPDIYGRIVFVEEEIIPENIHEIRDMVGREKGIPNGNIVFSVSEETARKVATQYKNEIKGNTLKILAIDPASPLHIEILVNFLFARVEKVFEDKQISEEMIGFIDLLPIFGYSKEQAEDLKKALLSNLYLPVKIIRMRETLEEFRHREIYINVSV